jgi:ATP-dependent Lon protease
MSNNNQLNNEIVEVNNENIIYGIPSIALRGKVIFPNIITVVDVGRIKSLNAVHVALKGQKLVFVVSQKVADIDDPTESDLYSVGTVCKVGNLTKIGTDNFKLTLEGLYRAKINTSDSSKDYFCFNVEKLPTLLGDALKEEACFRVVKESFLYQGKHVKALNKFILKKENYHE